MENSSVLSIGSLITFQLYWTMIRSNYSTITENAAAFSKAGTYCYYNLMIFHHTKKITAGAAGSILQLLTCSPSIDPSKGDVCSEIGGICLFFPK